MNTLHCRTNGGGTGHQEPGETAPGKACNWGTAPLPWLAPVVVGLVIRLAAAWVWEQQAGGRFVFGDSESYWLLARAIANGEEYRYGNARIFRMPGYPMVLAPLFWLASPEPPHLWARFLGAGLGSVTILGVYFLAKQLFGQGVGLWSAWTCVFYPGAIALSIFVLSEALFCPLVTLALVAGVKAAKSCRRAPFVIWSGVAGVLHGLAILTRPSWLFFPMFAGVISIAFETRRLRQLAGFLVMIAGASAVLAPWWVRNWCLTGRFVPATLQTGASLYDGLHPGATGASDLSIVNRRMGELVVEFNRLFPELTQPHLPGTTTGPMSFEEGSRLGGQAHAPNEQNGNYGKDEASSEDGMSPGAASGRLIEEKYEAGSMIAIPLVCGSVPADIRRQIALELFLDSRLRQEAIAWALAHPREFLRLMLRKFVRLWNIWPNEAAFQTPASRIVVASTFLPLIICSVFGIIRHSRRGWAYVLPVLPAVYLTGIHCVFVSSLRYREPAMLALIPLAVAGAKSFWDLYRGTAGERAAPMAASHARANR
ncbi:MAG: glycosyltransferase family 39 protein [Thermoguttaceae bacterium]|nr:glycosyltransferase family 39 protein [Thermoguttaceae bacterium]MDW8079473.1 glycosyltransferase family 39 protein [Thermoguttaceae bacterium]